MQDQGLGDRTSADLSIRSKLWEPYEDNCTRFGAHHPRKPMTLATTTSPQAVPNLPGYAIVEPLYLGTRTAVY
jgi:hypothetical protein